MRPVGSYGRLCTEFYDLDKPEAPPAALQFYWDAYEQNGGGPALEVMCGSGRFLVPFAARGADIDGIDASPEMLEACRRKLTERGLQARLYLQFAETLQLARSYRFAFVPGGSLVLVEPAVQDEIVRRLAPHLEPGALLAVELHTPAAGNYFDAAGLEVRRVRRPDGAEIVLSTEPGGAYRYVLMRDGTVIATEIESYGWHPRERNEFSAILAGAGFADIRTVRPYTADVATDGDGLIVYLARRSA